MAGHSIVGIHQNVFTDILYSNDTKISETVTIVAHNSFSNPDEGGYKIHNQQDSSFAEQLAIGVRGFMLDLHYCESGLCLCHENCDDFFIQLLQRGHGEIFKFQTFQNWLSKSKTFCSILKELFGLNKTKRSRSPPISV